MFIKRKSYRYNESKKCSTKTNHIKQVRISAVICKLYAIPYSRMIETNNSLKCQLLEHMNIISFTNSQPFHFIYYDQESQ